MTTRDHLSASDALRPEARVPDARVSESQPALERYLDGVASLEDEAGVREWLAAHPRAAGVTAAFLDEIEARADSEGSHISARAQAIVNNVRVMRETRQRAEPEQHRGASARRKVFRNVSPNRFRFLTHWPAIAVAGVAVLIAGVVVAPRAGTFFNSVGQRSYEYHTARAQRTTLELPDGTQVVLAPESEIRYEGGATGERKISLVGLAHFTVATDAKRLFRVKTGETVTQVLGTSFAVRAYQNEPDVQVAVTAGKVSVRNAGHDAVVLPGEVANVSPGDRPAVTRNARFADVLAWLRGELVFEDTPLPLVIAELERVYNVTIQLAAPTLENRRFSGSFISDPLPTVLESIAFTTNTAVTRNGNIIYIAER